MQTTVDKQRESGSAAPLLWTVRVVHSITEILSPQRVYVLQPSDVTIGRQSDGISSGEDAKVSRQHAAIRCEHGQFRLVDLGSRNGTYVNGEPIDHVELRDNDIITIGDFNVREIFAFAEAIRVHRTGEPDSTMHANNTYCRTSTR
jgi:pSer/pThr/pTyr-binding forkhead associated (FHA) protein